MNINNYIMLQLSFTFSHLDAQEFVIYQHFKHLLNKVSYIENVPPCLSINQKP